MKVYIQSREDGIPYNYNVMNAYQGFREMGFEIRHFHDNTGLCESSREDVVVGCVDTVRSRLHDFGITAPEIDYPDELSRYLGRKVWKTKMSVINSDPDK